ncbi:hypothetical protein V6U90_32975 [Micromonospora sp. CPCC 206060]|uniref:hypothetical protein n=1 Tax=Micromonospora sp. CPCC 206060 TaxID=3122406 RepID=UPI002FF16AD7
MARTNRASGNDRVAIQVGEVKPASSSPKDTTTAEDKPSHAGNTCTGNARVGIQADTVTGPIHITF